jgi:ankyrin repeat protein
MQEFFDAIKSGELERVKAMVSATPSLVNARGDGGSAILTAVYHQRKEIVNLLVARGAELTIFEACAAGELERVERLVIDSPAGRPHGAAPAGINAYSDDGWTPLHLAAFFGHARVVELLLAHGADTAARSTNPTANTPLHAALAANQKMVAGLLIGHGADVNAADGGGWRPLHLAAANNNLDALKTLVAQGADVGAANREGLTAVQLAEQKGHREAAAFLRRHGA